jgi:hypothetical protein
MHTHWGEAAAGTVDAQTRTECSSNDEAVTLEPEGWSQVVCHRLAGLSVSTQTAFLDTAVCCSDRHCSQHTYKGREPQTLRASSSPLTP